MTSAVRALDTLRRLAASRRGLTVRQLASRSGRSAKTVRRDLDAIRAAGWRILEVIEAFNRKRSRVELPTPGVAPVLRRRVQSRKQSGNSSEFVTFDI